VNFLIYIQLRLIDLPASFALELPPAAIVYLLMLFLPLAAAVAAGLLLLSAYAKTYKEAQLYFFPVYLLGLAPALAAVLPGIRLRSAVALVPVANVSVAVREILMGRPDPPMILVACAVMTLTGIWLMRTSARMLTQESVVVPAQLEAEDLAGGPALFRKRVLRWFAVMWAMIFAVAAGIPQLATFRAQILFNEVVVFLGAGLLMIKVYGLNVRETLSLRSVNPAAWLAVLIAIPPAHILGYACFRLANTIVPAPQQLLEQFSREFMPAGLPAWQLYFFVAVLPAICEEIGFRGLLLHGLRRRLQPHALVLVVGLIFGLFHVSLFRIAPTAFMGVVLTAIAVMTGSIFPGIVLHMGNNAFAVWVSGNNAMPLESLRWWDYFAAMLIFALAMWIIYRTRRAADDA
jgi:membrane protease YdiL (CAAX protease family)